MVRKVSTKSKIKLNRRDYLEIQINEYFHFNGNEIKFDFPNNLIKIFEFLNKNGAKPIVVGGYVRDSLLGLKQSKDIDVEVYNIDSYKRLKMLLDPFATTYEVGRSFGVCKVRIEDFECDFSLPRKENKVAAGHKGFAIELNGDLDFKEAARRRDFTINALGFDPIERKLLDPFGGLEDLKSKTLRAVDNETFVEDPLRILRGVVFAARFSMRFDANLFAFCKSMIEKKQLQELPKERVFVELEKLFFKAKKPSHALWLLYNMKERRFFNELFSLPRPLLEQTLHALDNLTAKQIDELGFYFAALGYFIKEPQIFLNRFTNEKKLLKKAQTLINGSKELYKLCMKGYSDYDLKLLATKVRLSDALVLIETIYDLTQKCEELKHKTQKLGIYHKAIEPKMTGKDLVRLGLKPNKNFKTILDKLYDMQLRGDKVDDEAVLQFAKR